MEKRVGRMGKKRAHHNISSDSVPVESLAKTRTKTRKLMPSGSATESLALKTPMRKQLRRKVKNPSHPSISCYDLFVKGDRERKHMCLPCINYADLVPKTKPQHEMGIRFYGCHGPKNVSSLPSHFPTAIMNGTICNDSDAICVTDSFPRSPKKKAKSSNLSPILPAELVLGDVNSAIAGAVVSTEKQNSVMSVELKLCKERLKEALQLHQNALSENEMASKNFQMIQKQLEDKMQELESSVKSKEKVYKSKIQKLKDKAKYKDKAILLTSELQQTQLQLAALRDKMESYVTMYEKEDPRAAAEVLIKELVAKSVSPSSIADGFLNALFDRKRCRKSFEQFIIDQGADLREVEKHFGDKRYLTLKEKFCPWICLRELDFVATVSFRGYEVIRRIEFSGLESAKYKRGLFHNRQQLSRLSKMLEAHGKELLPYDVTSNSVKFDLTHAVPWLLKQFRSWEYVERGELVTVAATVDGGELAWQLTQVSAGIKICDERAIDPLTGQRLFGDSGHERVQSRYVCFPLHVHIAKDNKQFYSEHLEEFFSVLNAIEDEYEGGLQFAQGADMCSLCKTVKRGGAMKNKKYGCYCCNIHKDDLAKPNSTPCPDCIRLGIEEACYHQEVSDEALMERLKREFEDLTRENPYLAEFQFKNSKIRSGSTAIRDHRSDHRHIDFDTTTASNTTCLQFRS